MIGGTAPQHRNDGARTRTSTGCAGSARRESFERLFRPVSGRIVCFELDGENQTVILDITARAFIAVTGTLDENDAMHSLGTHAGPLPLLKRIAKLIADDEQLAS